MVITIPLARRPVVFPNEKTSQEIGTRVVTRLMPTNRPFYTGRRNAAIDHVARRPYTQTPSVVETLVPISTCRLKEICLFRLPVERVVVGIRLRLSLRGTAVTSSSSPCVP